MSSILQIYLNAELDGVASAKRLTQEEQSVMLTLFEKACNYGNK